MKYLIIVGGVISGIGKGILASSCGVLLKSMGYKITVIKIDPYLNIDAGLMNPNEHGEVFVLNDGGEVDLDLGNYERSLNINLCSKNNITTGKIYKKVIDDERTGRYLGKTVQVVPHITNEIQDCITDVARIPHDSGDISNICIIELGGTIGDIESAPFVEALRQFKKKVGSDNFCLIQVTLVPGTDEQKSKPTQTSVKDLRSLGLIPDIIACRCKLPLKNEIRNKICLFCDVEDSHILSFHDCKTIYDVPILLNTQGLEDIFIKKFALTPIVTPVKIQSQYVLNINNNVPLAIIPIMLKSSYTSLIADTCETDNYLMLWSKMAESFHKMKNDESVSIAIVGKYTKNSDSYFSIIKALEHASSHIGKKVNIVWVESTDLEQGNKTQSNMPINQSTNVPLEIQQNNTIANNKLYREFWNSNEQTYLNAWHSLESCDGILVPGGFGSRGVLGKIAAIKYARENNKPFLGICFGMQLAIIEFARNVMNLSDADSEELNPNCKDKMIIHMPEIDQNKMGGTQRLGIRETSLLDGSKTKSIYGNVNTIHERHRHRYEVNPKYVIMIENAGLKIVGKDIKQERMEIIELPSHPYFIATQFHPEYLSRPLKPAPLFISFVNAVVNMSHTNPLKK
jgi:CTP synthase